MTLPIVESADDGARFHQEWWETVFFILDLRCLFSISVLLSGNFFQFYFKQIKWKIKLVNKWIGYFDHFGPAGKTFELEWEKWRRTKNWWEGLKRAHAPVEDISF